MDNIGERLDSLKEKIQEQDFLESKGLSNEVNIQVFCYPPEKEMTVRYFMDKLDSDDDLKCHVIHYDLYEVFISILKDKNILDKVGVLEEKKGSDFILKQLQSIASVDKFIEKMKYAPHKTGDVVMLTGIGEVYPFMRAHILLDAMQADFNDLPVVVMYPGSYDGNYLKLFNTLEASPYYRAFNMI